MFSGSVGSCAGDVEVCYQISAGELKVLFCDSGPADVRTIPPARASEDAAEGSASSNRLREMKFFQISVS